MVDVTSQNSGTVVHTILQHLPAQLLTLIFHTSSQNSGTVFKQYELLEKYVQISDEVRGWLSQL